VIPLSPCLVTNRLLCANRGLLDVVAEALAGGVRAVQLREKDLSARELLSLAKKIRTLTEHTGAALIINDRVDVAMTVGAQGVHLGARTLPVVEVKRIAPDMITGVSCHSVSDVLRAEQEGADYMVLGPIFETLSKGRPEGGLGPLGLEVLREACGRCARPVLAIGGIVPERMLQILGAGAAGVAVVGAFLGSKSPADIASELVAASQPPAGDVPRMREGAAAYA